MKFWFYFVIQVLIVEGETGSGKTTQIPQYLYEAVSFPVQFTFQNWNNLLFFAEWVLPSQYPGGLYCRILINAMGISLNKQKLMYNILMPSIIALYKFLWTYGGSGCIYMPPAY